VFRHSDSEIAREYKKDDEDARKNVQYDGNGNVLSKDIVSNEKAKDRGGFTYQNTSNF
jgi:hypothetical protein